MRKRIPSIFAISGFVLLSWFLAWVFSGRIVLSQYFSIGPLTIHYYGIIMALAVASAFYLANKSAERHQLNAKKAEDLLLWVAIAGFAGARIYHVASHFDYYLQYPSEIVKVWNGGLSIYGAVLGGLIGLWVCKKLLTANYSLATLLDWLTPSLIVGQIIGRFGNMFNYEAFGYPTSLPWKMFVPLRFRPDGYQAQSFFHPFFLYEALGNAAILFLLLKIFKFKSPGSLFFSYLLLYNMLRFGLEFIRLDSTWVSGIRFNALIALLFIGFAAVYLIYKNKDVKAP